MHSPHCGTYRGITVSPLTKRFEKKKLKTEHIVTTAHNMFNWDVLLHTRLEFDDTFTNTLHSPCTLMAQDDREKSLGVTATECVGICVTHPCGKQLKDKVLDNEIIIMIIIEAKR